MKQIAKIIKTLRHKKGWSQEGLASRLGITSSALSKIEGGLTDLNVSRLEQIAVLFQMSVAQLLTYTDSDQGTVAGAFDRYSAQSSIKSATGERGASLDHEQVELVKEKLAKREAEIIVLQKKIIGLLESQSSLTSY